MDVMVEEPNVALPVGTIAGAQLAAVLKSPDPGLATQIASCARVVAAAQQITEKRAQTRNHCGLSESVRSGRTAFAIPNAMNKSAPASKLPPSTRRRSTAARCHHERRRPASAGSPCRETDLNSVRRCSRVTRYEMAASPYISKGSKRLLSRRLQAAEGAISGVFCPELHFYHLLFGCKLGAGAPGRRRGEVASPSPPRVRVSWRASEDLEPGS